MKVLAKEKSRVLADSRHWSQEFAEGFLEGELYRRRAKSPTPYHLVGMDQYSSGFRAGFFERISPPAAVREPASQALRFARLPN